MNALEQKLVSLLHPEFQALLEKIESLEGGDSDYMIADFINRSPLNKFERFMLVRAYRRYETRTSRFKAMELLFPPRTPQVADKYAYAGGSNGLTASTLLATTAKAEGARIVMPRSKVGNI